MGKAVDIDAFNDQDTIVSVVFGEQCKTIGARAFHNCDKLKNINNDNIVESINEQAFFECASLKDVEFKKVKNIGTESFSGCSSLTFVAIPSCVSIGISAFKNCKNLQIVEKGNAQTRCRIEDSAFEGCEALHTIYMDNCTHIGNKAFANCKNIVEVKLNGCEYIGNEAFSGCEKITQVNLSVCKSIGIDAFSGCNNLKRVYINNPPEIPCVLGDKVFCNCDPSEKCNCEINFYFRPETYERILKDINNATNNNDWSSWKYYIDHIVVLPNANQIIYTSLKNKPIDINNATNIEKHTYGKYGLIEFKKKIENLNKNIFTISNPENLISITLPSECKTIGRDVFGNCVNLESVTIYSDLEKIDSYAFNNCKSLKSFVIPNTVKTLGEGIFIGCENIENFEGKFVTYNGKAIVYKSENNVNTLICVSPKVNIGKLKTSDISLNIDKLGEGCFYGCVNLRRIDISSNVMAINKNAFAKCENLYEIYLHNNTWPITVIANNKLFGEEENDTDYLNILNNLKIFVPDGRGRLSTYLVEWKEYKQYIRPTPQNNSIICFSNKEIANINMELVVIDNEYSYYRSPSDLNTMIPAQGFYRNRNITEVIIGENITVIGANAFNGCDSLQYIHLSDKTNTLGDNCFLGCSSLTSIHIPSNLSATGTNIFNNCSNIKEFKEYEKKYVTNDSKCVIIGNGETLMFFAPYDMTTYSIPDSVTRIGNSAFCGSQIEEINLNNVTYIGNYGFADCTKLVNISFEKINYIGDYAFRKCTNLHGIKLSENIQRIGKYAFEGCAEIFLENNIPDSLTEIGEGAFKNCTKFRCSTSEGFPALNLSSIWGKINKYTFENCTNLNSVIIGNNINTIDEKAFMGCTGLENITLSSNLTTINKEAFKGCIKLCEATGKLYLPNDVNYIGTSAFYNCSSISDIILPSGLKTMCSNCLNFTPTTKKINITIPDELTSPPSFDDEYSYPFGNPLNINANYELQINIPYDLEYTYRNNKYWKKYINYFVTTGTGNLKLESCFRVYCNIDGLYIRFYRNIPYEWTGSTVLFSITDRTDKDLMTFGGVLILDPKLADKDSIPFAIRVGTVANQDDINNYKGKSLKIYDVRSSSGKDLSDIYSGNPISIGDDLNSDIIF
jgi:hypothetical protein